MLPRFSTVDGISGVLTLNAFTSYRCNSTALALNKIQASYATSWLRDKHNLLTASLAPNVIPTR